MCAQLTNLIAGTTEQCGQVLNAGALPVFVRMLSDHRADYREGQEQAVWAVRVTLKQVRGKRTQDGSILIPPAVCVLLLCSDRQHRR